MNPETIRQVVHGAGPTVDGATPPEVKVVHRQHRKARERAGWRIERVGPARGVGRNRPCPCGSGKKNKHCCGR